MLVGSGIKGPRGSLRRTFTTTLAVASPLAVRESDAEKILIRMEVLLTRI